MKRVCSDARSLKKNLLNHHYVHKVDTYNAMAGTVNVSAISYNTFNHYVLGCSRKGIITYKVLWNDNENHWKLKVLSSTDLVSPTNVCAVLA